MTRTALVTGANRGIGLEFVRQLLARGDRVIAACRQPGKATALNALGGEHPGRLHVLPLDVASEKSRSELVRELPLVLGEDECIDLLLNNAGVLHSGERFGQLRQELLEDSLRTNALGPLLLAQVIAPLMRDGDGDAKGVGTQDANTGGGAPVIANLSSQLGSIAGVHRFGTPGYAISKAAQNMATAQLAQALAARGIVVLALHPGWVQTDMGGERAPDAPVDVVAGMLRVIDAATPAHAGGFFDWRGEPLPW
jgi:NAD(P)-dependent dehydrogenase (short-subunit alcohol dehydrogenase family)